MTKEELMAIRLRQILPYLQAHQAMKGNVIGPQASGAALTPQEAAEIEAIEKAKRMQMEQRRM
jgi:hypothetical protein